MVDLTLTVIHVVAPRVEEEETPAEEEEAEPTEEEEGAEETPPEKAPAKDGGES